MLLTLCLNQFCKAEGTGRLAHNHLCQTRPSISTTISYKLKNSLFYPPIWGTANSWQNLQLGGGWGRWTLGGGAGLATAGCLGPVFDATLMEVVVKVEGEAGGAIAKDKITARSSMNTFVP